MKRKKQKSIYDLRLHETLFLGTNISYERVPGGWVRVEYYENGVGLAITSVFIPEPEAQMICTYEPIKINFRGGKKCKTQKKL